MAVLTKRTPRLFVDPDLAPGQAVPLARDKAHYLTHVLRLKEGDAVRAFNGTSGEWLCRLAAEGRRAFTLRPEEQLALPQLLPDIDYLFAPLKHARLDYLAQKATEMGCRRLMPVFTERTQAERVNIERLKANAIEAAEQCDMIAVPEVLAPVRLDQILAAWEGERTLIWCDESRPGEDPLAVLAKLTRGPLAVLIGPEGGFSDGERDALRRQANAHAVGLGPRIMRADTAAVAALALVQAMLGDWTDR
ncbi:MAG: 16S rRNA (uracil(1498)-N(3))-methyltransferase [Aestuariivirgaceae bacterium]